MTLLHRLISAGFAVSALASASVPALAWTIWPDVDFEWYANVGKPLASPAIETFPAPRPGYIWSPAHWETVSGRPTWVAGQWIRDDYEEQVALYGNGKTSVAAGPMALYDRQGNPIPADPRDYPIDSSRR